MNYKKICLTDVIVVTVLLRAHPTQRAPDVRQAGVIIGQIPVPAAGNANRSTAGYLPPLPLGNVFAL